MQSHPCFMKTLDCLRAMTTSPPDVTDLFNYLTGYSTQHEFKKLLVAPINLRSGLEKLVRREIEHARAGQRHN